MQAPSVKITMLIFLGEKEVQWSFLRRLYSQKLVLVAVLVLESKGLHYRQIFFTPYKTRFAGVSRERFRECIEKEVAGKMQVLVGCR